MAAKPPRRQQLLQQPQIIAADRRRDRRIHELRWLDPDALHQPDARRQLAQVPAGRLGTGACRPAARSRCCRSPLHPATGRARRSPWSWSSPPYRARSSVSARPPPQPAIAHSPRTATPRRPERPSPVILTLSVASSPAPAKASSARRYSPISASIWSRPRQLLAQDVDRRGAPRAGQPPDRRQGVV